MNTSQTVRSQFPAPLATNLRQVDSSNAFALIPTRASRPVRRDNPTRGIDYTVQKFSGRVANMLALFGTFDARRSATSL